MFGQPGNCINVGGTEHKKKKTNKKQKTPSRINCDFFEREVHKILNALKNIMRLPCKEGSDVWVMGGFLVALWIPSAAAGKGLADVCATTSHIAPGATKILFHEICLRMQQHQHQRLWQPKSLLILESLFCAGNKQNCARLPPHTGYSCPVLGRLGASCCYRCRWWCKPNMHHHNKWCDLSRWGANANRCGNEPGGRFIGCFKSLRGRCCERNPSDYRTLIS